MAKNGFKILDSDMHIMEPPDMWERYIASDFRDRAPRTNTREPRDMMVEVQGQTIPTEISRNPVNLEALQKAEAEQAQRYSYAIERGWDSISQLKAMDDEGIDVAVFYPSRGLMPLGTDQLDPDLAAAIATAYNDWMYDFCQENPNRMYGAAMVAPHNVPAAVREVRRAVENFGFRAIFLRPNIVGGYNWHDPHYDPLWYECEQLGISVGFHEGGRVRLPQIGGQFETIALYHTCSFPMEAMLVMVSMIGGGVLERFPNLKIAVLEANCWWVPGLLWRLKEHLEPERLGNQHPDLKMAPLDYFQRQCYVSVEPDEELITDTIHRVGDSNIVFSTDYPHNDSKYPHAVDRFLELPLSDKTKRKLLWDDCANFYGFPLT